MGCREILPVFLKYLELVKEGIGDRDIIVIGHVASHGPCKGHLVGSTILPDCARGRVCSNTPMVDTNQSCGDRQHLLIIPREALFVFIVAIKSGFDYSETTAPLPSHGLCPHTVNIG